MTAKVNFDAMDVVEQALFIIDNYADIFLDNLAPLGDGHMQVEGYDVPLFPLSGINAAMITWMIVAGVVEKMNAKGAQPQIWKSANIDGGADRNRQVETEIVDKVGY